MCAMLCAILCAIKLLILKGCALCALSPSTGAWARTWAYVRVRAGVCAWG